MRSSKIFNLIVRNYTCYMYGVKVFYFCLTQFLNRKARLQQNTRIKI